MLIRHAVGLTARVDTPAGRDPVHVRDLQPPRSASAGVNRHGVYTGTEWHDLDGSSINGQTEVISRAAAHAGPVGKVERAGREARESE